MNHFLKRLFRRRQDEIIKEMETQLMITQDMIDALETRIKADTAKIVDLEAKVTNLTTKLAAVPPAAPDVNATNLEAAVTAQEAAFSPA